MWIVLACFKECLVTGLEDILICTEIIKQQQVQAYLQDVLQTMVICSFLKVY